MACFAVRTAAQQVKMLKSHCLVHRQLEKKSKEHCCLAYFNRTVWLTQASLSVAKGSQGWARGQGGVKGSAMVSVDCECITVHAIIVQGISYTSVWTAEAGWLNHHSLEDHYSLILSFCFAYPRLCMVCRLAQKSCRVRMQYLQAACKQRAGGWQGLESAQCYARCHAAPGGSRGQGCGGAAGGAGSPPPGGTPPWG